MKKQWVLVCVLAGALLGSEAAAQHKAPNQQPSTAEAPASPAGDMTLGTVRLPRGVTADGKPLAAGTYQVKLTAQQAAPEAVGTTEALERWVELTQGKEVKGREVVSIVPSGRDQDGGEGRAAGVGRLEGPDAARERLPAGLDQPRRESLPDSLSGRGRGYRRAG